MLAIALGFVVMHAMSPIPGLQGDGYYTYMWARSLAFDGDMLLANDYAAFFESPHDRALNWPRTPRSRWSTTTWRRCRSSTSPAG